MTPCLLRLPDVIKVTGQSRSEIYRGMKRGSFPQSLTIIGTRIKAWDSSEVDAWVRHQIATAPRGGASHIEESQC